MKKILSVLFISVFVLTTFLSPAVVSATQLQPAPGSTSGGSLNAGDTASRWVIDPEVTFIGKNAARAGLFLDWTLKNYNWVCVTKVTERQCDDSNNPIAKYWSLIVLYIVVPLLFVVILATSIVIIITRGKSLTIMKFIPRFIAVVLLIVFSYSLLQFLYQFTDLIQGFFLRSNINNACPPDCISQKDLLYVGWDYRTFIGLRLLGDMYAESAFISLLLTKLTALTYFVMVFLLLVRKIILWFFIIVSPIFPILLLYYPVRNTAKIWIGEFFRWLLYAPLFAVFLNGLVYLWKNGIPLVFINANRDNASQIVFPTAVNILLGGPKEYVTPTNSINLVETFALYVVSLIMLWIVILLPWILLQIFLDYASNFAPGDTAVMKTLVNMATTNRQPPGTGPQPPSEGAAVELPFSKKFTIPKDLQPGPTGAAKELNIGQANLKATFAQPATFSANMNNAQVNAQVVAIANVKVPTMRDIAKYDSALISRDQNKQVEVTRITQQLEKIANPVVVTNTVEKNQVTEIHEKITEKAQQGNLVASSIMNAANIASRNSTQVSNQEVKNVLSQIANPATSSNTNREKMSKLNEVLVKESKSTSKNNQSQLAQSILSVNEKTSDKEISRIKDQLKMASNTSFGKSVNTAISQNAQSSSQIKNVLQQMANPNSVVHTADKQSVTKLKATLEKAKAEGNELASSILKVNDKTSVEELESLQSKIQEARKKGEPIATQISALAQQTTTLPQTNRVQTVNKQDYQAVRDMWKQNYQNLEVPQGMAGTRADWIKDDIADIDQTIALLSSPDQDKVKEGMDRVSNILPFLMMGGFSQTEIVEYLKAKQDAAKEVSKTLAVEEEDKVEVKTTATHAEKTMVATMEEENTSSSSSTTSSTTTSSDTEEDESPLSNITSTTSSTVSSNSQGGTTNITNNSSSVNYTQPQINNEIMNMVNLKVPKLQDIARFETRALQKDETRTAEIQNVQTVLGKIANPAGIPDAGERAQFEKVRQTLIEERQKGNPTANVLLNASMKTQGKATENVKTVLAQIANPSLAKAEADKKRFTELHDSLQKASENGNELAKSILTTHEATPLEDIKKLSEKLKEEKAKGEPVAASIFNDLPDTKDVPDQNELQPVSDEDYAEVKKLWEENYRTLPVPAEYGSEATGRIAWITADIKNIEETIALLEANDTEKEQQGMQKVSEILPMLMLGGFSQNEIIGYLKAKVEAGNTVIAELQKEEEGKVTVAANTQQTAAAQEMNATTEDEKKGGEGSSS